MQQARSQSCLASNQADFAEQAEREADEQAQIVAAESSSEEQARIALEKVRKAAADASGYAETSSQSAATAEIGRENSADLGEDEFEQLAAYASDARAASDRAEAASQAAQESLQEANAAIKRFDNWFIDNLMVLIILLALALAGGILGWLFLKNREESKSAPAKKNTDGVAKALQDRAKNPGSANNFDIEAENAELRKENERLKRELSHQQQTNSKLNAALVRKAAAGGAPPRPGADESQREPRANDPFAGDSRGEEQRPAPRRATSFAESDTARQIADRLNNATKADINRGGSDLGVENYTNDRLGSLDIIFPNEADRFWLKVNPDDPSEALLFPGMQTRLDWSKLKTVTADHPLTHHFDLQPGERLAVKRPAILRKVDGDWKLETKGIVSGVTG